MSLHLPSALKRLPAEMETSLFRLVQEGLTNIHRHSGSKTADISLVCDGSELHLRIEDHGKGMAVGKVSGRNGSPVAGVGIAGMRERVRELGGTLHITSSHNKTQVNVTLPLPLLAKAQTA